MINLTLFKKEWRTNWILLIIFIGVIAMYAIMIVTMFDPKLGDSLKLMAEGMPEIFAAFGMLEVGATLMEFISGYLYGIILTAFPSVFILILCNRLVAKYVDDGSMAYLLSAPEKRSTFIRTQIAFTISTLIALILLVILMIYGSSEMMFPGELDFTELLRANVGLAALWIMIGGICFCCSCVFNETKYALSVSAAVVIYGELVRMISQVGDKFENLKYVTPLTLFDVDGLVANESGAWVLCGIMLLVGIVGFAAGSEVFKRKDLPI